MAEKSKIEIWDEAFNKLKAAHAHRRDMQGKPGAELAEKDFQAALDDYAKASGELE